MTVPLQHRLLEVQLLSLLAALVGDVSGVVALTTVGVAGVALSLLALFVVMGVALAGGVGRWVGARPVAPDR